jgi:hypothetical protein
VTDSDAVQVVEGDELGVFVFVEVMVTVGVYVDVSVNVVVGEPDGVSDADVVPVRVGVEEGVGDSVLVGL